MSTNVETALTKIAEELDAIRRCLETLLDQEEIGTVDARELDRELARRDSLHFQRGQSDG